MDYSTGDKKLFIRIIFCSSSMGPLITIFRIDGHCRKALYTYKIIGAGNHNKSFIVICCSSSKPADSTLRPVLNIKPSLFSLSGWGSSRHQDVSVFLYGSAICLANWASRAWIASTIARCSCMDCCIRPGTDKEVVRQR